MLQTKFQGSRSVGSGAEDFFKYFYQMWAWWTYWSCDLDGLNIFSFPQQKEALHEIWLQLAHRLLSRCLKLSNYESPGSQVKE